MTIPDKDIRLRRTDAMPPGHHRPVMLAIAGDSAAGKTTLTRGLAEALGPDQATAICVDDYHRYDRQERRGVPFTVLNPDCNYIDVMEQHLQLLAMGRPILKPVYDHSTGRLVRPALVEPREFVIVEGLLPLHTKLARACFDITVYLDPPEDVRKAWKLRRDCAERGYAEAEVRAEIARREPDSAAYIRPQRQWADISIRFAPVASRADPAGTPLSAEILLRPQRAGGAAAREVMPRGNPARPADAPPGSGRPDRHRAPRPGRQRPPGKRARSRQRRDSARCPARPAASWPVPRPARRRAARYAGAAPDRVPRRHPAAGQPR
jgi:uridine kinase